MHIGSKRVLGLDVLRSLAIILVLACHLFSWELGWFPFSSAMMGIYGVEIFFVLSGFLIGSILMRDTEEHATFGVIAGFWKRRWYRTLPNYYFYLLLILAGRSPSRHDPGNWPVYILFLQNFAWPMGPYFSVSWSLAIEEWFYLLFPIAVFAFACRVRSSRGAFCAALLFFLVIGFLNRWLFTDQLSWLNGVMGVVVFRLDSIVLGVGLAYLKRYHMRVWSRLCSPLTLIAAGLLIAGICFWIWKCGYLQPLTPASGPQNAISVELLGLSCALILPWFTTIQRLNFPATFAFTWISILSYSLYLSQQLAEIVLNSLVKNLNLSLNPYAHLAGVTALVIVLALFSYNFVEKPFLRMRDKAT